MKKIVALLIALTMLFALVACGDTLSNETDPGLFMESWDNVIRDAGYEMARIEEESDRFDNGRVGQIESADIVVNDRDYVEIVDEGGAGDDFCRWISQSTEQAVVWLFADTGRAQAIFIGGEEIYCYK